MDMSKILALNNRDYTFTKKIFKTEVTYYLRMKNQN